jgi:hypothetical protein
MGMSPGALRRGTAAFSLLFVMLAVPAFAQVTTGDIAGRVLDEQGNAVPGATITARNSGTGLSRTTTTDTAGEYVVRQLPPGTYSVTVELTGFRKAVVNNYAVNVGLRQTLNFDLKVGAVAESVEVTAEGALIETTKSDISGVVTSREIENLPLLNRTFAGLSIMMPEARPVGNFDPTKTRIGNFAMNGGDGRQLDVNVDGGDNKDNVVGSLLQNFAYESIQEFQVLQHRWTAEQGRAVGGVINVVTKSGTNELRGSLFGSHRSNETRAKDFFEKRNNLEKTKFERQEFGGSLGGPIVKDKLFFFGAAERFRERSDTLVDPRALPQLAAIPGADPVNLIPTPYDDTLVTLKLDHRISDKHTVFYRYSYQGNTSPNDQVASPARTDLTGGNSNDNKLHSFVFNHTWTLAGSRLNQFSFHFQNFRNEIFFPGGALKSDRPLITFPSVQTGANVNVPQQTLEKKFQFRNDFTWHTGNHGLKFGANYIYTDLGGFFFFGSSGYTINFFDDPLTILNNRTLYPQGFQTPGAVQGISFFDGESPHDQTVHQVAAYIQDDWRVSSKLTLNLGLRWDANIGNLPDQTTNRTIEILSRLDDPLARQITGDAGKLSRSTPSWTEFQPRIGFAYDPQGDGRTVIRGGYGIFYDQVFQNLTLFSLGQSGSAGIYQQVMNLTNTAVGVGQLGSYVFNLNSLPAPPAYNVQQLARGAFGRINDPDISEPYVHKFSLGFQRTLGKNWSVSSDYVHTLGIHESRVHVINPRIQSVCDPTFPGSTPADPRCVRGANTRYFDAAFVRAGLGAGRLEQINMIGTTNRSLFDSWTTTLKGRFGKSTVSLSYVLASSRAWGGQPVASYSGNGIAVAPANQFKEEEFGPTRIDERHRVVASAVFDLPAGFQIAPLIQYASPRPYSPTAGFDVDGDGLATIDRICATTDLGAVFAARGNSAAIRALNPRGCTQAKVNGLRSGFIVNSDGTVEEVSLRYFNVDVRVSKAFKFGDTVSFKVFADLYNLLNTRNLNIGGRLGLSPATSAAQFQQPVALYGPGFGPPVGRPFTAVFGARLDF